MTSQGLGALILHHLAACSRSGYTQHKALSVAPLQAVRACMLDVLSHLSLHHGRFLASAAAESVAIAAKRCGRALCREGARESTHLPGLPELMRHTSKEGLLPLVLPGCCCGLLPNNMRPAHCYLQCIQGRYTGGQAGSPAPGSGSCGGAEPP